MIFDIGSNNFDWAIANYEIADKIISVEASIITFKKYIHKIHNYHKIVPLNYAISDQDNKIVVLHQCSKDNMSTLDKSYWTDKSSPFHYGFTHKNINITS